jgi:FkbM family methyltransferase
MLYSKHKFLKYTTFNEINLGKKLFFYLPFYLLHKNYFFGYFFKKFIKIFHYNFKNKNFFFYIPDNLNYSFYSSFLTKTYEINDLILIKRNLNPDCTPIVIGGGLGFIAAIVSTIVKKKIPVFEIDTKILPFLKKNLKKNNIDSKIYNSFFFFNKKPKINFFFEDDNFITTSIYNLKKTDNNFIKLNNSTSYKELCKINKVTYNTLIIDAEGYEYDLINDISKDNSIKHIFFELHTSIIGKKRTNILLRSLKANKFNLIDNFLNSYYYSRSK